MVHREKSDAPPDSLTLFLSQFPLSAALHVEGNDFLTVIVVTVRADSVWELWLMALRAYRESRRLHLHILGLLLSLLAFEVFLLGTAIFHTPSVPFNKGYVCRSLAAGTSIQTLAIATLKVYLLYTRLVKSFILPSSYPVLYCKCLWRSSALHW